MTHVHPSKVHVFRCVYYIDLAQKSRKKKKKERKKKGRAKDDTQQDDDEAQDVSEEEEDEEEAPPKPEPPEKLELEAIERQVREKASRIRRNPGEPILIPVLSASGTITATELCPRYEHRHTDPCPPNSHWAGKREMSKLKERWRWTVIWILVSAFQGRKKPTTGRSPTLLFHQDPLQ